MTWEPDTCLANVVLNDGNTYWIHLAKDYPQPGAPATLVKVASPSGKANIQNIKVSFFKSINSLQNRNTKTNY